MNPKRILLLAVLVTLLSPAPSYAMLELLPFFVAGTALCATGFGAILGALVKAPLLRLISGKPVQLPLGPLCGVTLAEAAIMAISFFVSLFKLGSGPPAGGDSAAMSVGALFASSGILSWVINLVPNLYLLGKVSDGAGTGRGPIERPEYAAVLAVQAPLFTFVLLALMYLGLR